jgi:hypothetical protein
MALEPNDLTLLVITGPGIAPYSARGLVQSYDPISASQHIEESVNGNLVVLSPKQFRKYRTKITCTDHNTPALSGVWPGDVVDMECAEPMSFRTDHPQMQERDAVDGSVFIVGDYTFYRPILRVMFLGFNTSGHEFLREVSWSMDFSEAFRP